MLSLLLPFPVWASCTSTQSGNITYHSCSDGSSGMTQSIGSTRYHSSSDGSSGTGYRSGNTTYQTNRYGDGTTYRSGRSESQQWSDGSSVSTTSSGSSAQSEIRPPATQQPGDAGVTESSRAGGPVCPPAGC